MIISVLGQDRPGIIAAVTAPRPTTAACPATDVIADPVAHSLSPQIHNGSFWVEC